MNAVRLRPPSPTIQTGVWAALACLALVTAVLNPGAAPISVALPTPLLVAVMVTAAAWSEVGYVRLPSAPVRATTPATGYTAVAQTVAVLVLPADLALLSVAVGAVAGQLVDRRTPLKIVFNAAVHTAGAGTAAVIVHAGPADAPGSLVSLLRWLTAALAYETVTWLGVGLVVAAATSESARGVLRSTWTGAGTNMALTALTAVLLQVSWFHALLGLAPAMGIRSAYAKMSQSERRARTADQERDLFAQTVSGVSDAVLLCRADGRIELASPASEDLLGLTPGQQAAQPYFDAVADLGDGIGRRVVFEDLLNLRRLDGRPAVTDLTLRGGAAGGRDRAVRVSLTAQRGGDGSLATAVVVLHDRTDDHELSKLKDEFVARVSHELRTPLTPIITYSQLLTRYRSDMEDAAVQETASTIHDRAQHMLAMIEDLLQVSKIAAGEQLSSQAERIRLDVVLDELAGDVGLQYPQHTLHTDVGGTVTVVADPGHVRQVLSNLLTNACKYSPPGPVEVAVRCTDGVATVDVHDHGAGIAQADRERIFAQFERLSSTASSTAGTGVGLHIARNIARSLGGDLTLHRSGPGGSTFRWVLPRRRDSPCSDTPPAAAALSGRAG